MKKLSKLVMCVMFGVLMFISKMLMEFLPNIHLLAMFIVLFTVLYRSKALISIYVYVFLDGFIHGFSAWWIPYLYIWTVLWAVAMLLPKNMPDKVAVPVYSIVCALHGLLFGTLYAPVQALLFGLDFRGMIAWIIAGLPYDAIHAAGNLLTGMLVVPLAAALKKATTAVMK